MRFSIIVPVYNVERYIEECLESIKSQSFNEYEIIVVNDGSNDTSGIICKRFARSNPDMQIRIIDQENKGLLLARRAGICAAEGEYCMHVDGDDAIRQDALELINTTIESNNPDLILIRGSFSRKYTKCQLGALPWSVKTNGLQNKLAVLGAFVDGYIPNLCFKVAKRSCVDHDRGYEEYAGLTIGEDQLQSLYLLDRAEKICYLDEALYYYRQTPSSSTGCYRPGKQTQYGSFKEAVYRQAEKWDERYPGNKFASRALRTYLSNAYYDIRKSAHRKTISRELDELRATPLFLPALDHLSELRIDQKLFCICVRRGWDQAAYSLCALLRNAELLRRLLPHAS